MRILLVEDDQRLAAALTQSLARHGMTTHHVASGRAALDAVDRAEFVLLDLALPDIDGITVCQTIRDQCDLPVIILTGRGGVDERVRGLHAGADDYLVKPFHLTELTARIKAVCRRRNPHATTPRRFQLKNIEINLIRQTVTVDGTDISLSRKEFQLLALLANENGEICTRDHLVAEIWGKPWKGAYDTLNVHVATLRSKIGRPELVETIRGVGYRLTTCSQEPVR